MDCFARCTSTILITVTTVSAVLVGCQQPVVPPPGPLSVKLDARGPYFILTSQEAQSSYSGAIAEARKLHPNAETIVFDPARLPELSEKLKLAQPRYAMLFLEPQELDVNFAWKWLTLTTQLDNDPFVDVRSGFVTGDSPESVESFVKRIGAAVHGEAKLPGKMIDNFGPNTQGQANAFYQSRGNFFLPAYEKRFALESITHGAKGFSDDRLKAMDGAGMLHFGGHGYPDRVDEGVLGTQARRLTLAPCIAFNGACYTGVTSRWFDQWSADGNIAEHRVTSEKSFCLGLLSNQAIAYLAALHPDHGIPVYQEMEYLAYSGASLGDVMKYTHDGVVMGAGGKLPEFEELLGGSPRPTWTPADVMLKGTAARVLFGDPALVVGEPFSDPPFQISIDEREQCLFVTATLSNKKLKSTYTDTYHADLAWDRTGFNDRVLIQCDLPAEWKSATYFDVYSFEANGKPLKHRVVAHGIEHDNGQNRLNVQIDVPTTAYMTSPFRSSDSKVVVKLTR